jgi:hypothetical protein
MALPNIFLPETTNNVLTRLENIKAETVPQWGKMNAAQMLAHLNKPYDLAYGKITTKPSFIGKLLMKLIVKKIVVSEKPYAKNSRTAPEFIVADKREFEIEKSKYIANVIETEKKGSSYFDMKESGGMGKLTVTEWNNLFYKHTNHHFEQFGV